MNASVLGVRIDPLNKEEVIQRIKNGETHPVWIVTTNPEMLLYAKQNPSYSKTLNQADLRLVDGFGLWLACAMTGIQNAHRVAGADLAEHLLQFAEANRWRIALVGGKDEVAQKALAQIHKRYPALSGIAERGGVVANDGLGDAENEAARKRLIVFDPHIVLVGFGHPKQERWIERYRNEFMSARVIIGVGGTFDFWSGNIPRAPKWMRAVGIEWLYRLIREPKRWKRIWNAVIVFPIMVLRERGGEGW